MVNSQHNPAKRRVELFGRRFAGHGDVSGVVHVIRDEQEVSRFREGEILVGSVPDSAWLPLLSIAKGFITEAESADSDIVKAAIERDLPTLLGVENASHELRSGDIITLHANGLITRREERREPDSPMRVSVPAAMAVRDLANQVAADAHVISLAAHRRVDNDRDDETDQLNAN